MYSSTATSTQTAQAFDLQELCARNEREYKRKKRQIHIYHRCLNAHDPFMHVLPRSSYPVHVHSGKRIEGRIDLDVFDGEEGEDVYDLIKPLGKHYLADRQLEIYMLHSARAYEIRSAGNLLKTIRFPANITTTVQCA